MVEDLEHERTRLLARMAELELKHAHLHANPEDHPWHKEHLERLRAYQDEARAYRANPAASRRESDAYQTPDPF